MGLKAIVGNDDGSLSHTPGRDHNRKSKEKKTSKHGKKMKDKKDKAWRIFIEKSKEWDKMSDDARKLRDDLDPEKYRPKGKMPIMTEKQKLIFDLDAVRMSLRYWLYKRNALDRANKLYFKKLNAILRNLDKYDLNMSIAVKEGHALLCELQCDYKQAASYRIQEIDLIRQLIKLVKYEKPSVRKTLLHDCDQKTIRNRQLIVENLLVKAGNK